MLRIEANFLVIDCQPHLSAVVGVADLALVPCGASAADISATAKTLDLVHRAREVRGGPDPAQDHSGEAGVSRAAILEGLKATRRAAA